MYNNHTVAGNVGKQPEFKMTKSGLPVLEFSLATSEKVKGEKKTEWHNVVIFGKSAEAASKFIHKGTSLLVSGKSQTSSWDDKRTGVKKYKVKILANDWKLLGGEAKVGTHTASRAAPAGMTNVGNIAPIQEYQRAPVVEQAMQNQQAPVYEDDLPF